MTGPIRIHLLALVLVLGTGSQATSQTAGADTTGGPVSAFILTISGNPLGGVDVPVAAIRAAVSKELSSTLLKWGPIVPQERMLGIMAARRVRDGRSVSRELLDSLAVGFDVRRVMIATVVINRNRVTIAARHIDTETARLLDVVLEDRHIKPDREAAIATLREISRIAADVPLRSTTGAQTLLILDTTPVGCSDDDALIAGHILLQHYVARGDRAVIDPAVANATLHAAGYSERYIGSDARTLLRNAFGCSALVSAQLISYAPERRPSSQLLPIDDAFARSGPVLTDFAMSLRLIDLETGWIRAVREAFLPVPPSAGWFGVPADDTLTDRMKMAADRLWNDLHNALEAF